MARRDSFSQYNTDTIGVGIVELNVLTDPDGQDVRVTILREVDSVEVVSLAAATRDDEGLYSYQIAPTLVTNLKGSYRATWTYEVSGDPRIFPYEFEVVDPQPFFDSLNSAQRQMVENVYHHVSDGFDSTIGGPYLWEMPQSRFNFETVAKLMVVDAITYLNFASPKAFIPPYQVGNDVPHAFPGDWYGLLERATTYELYKHLATSYLEIPTPVGVDVAYLDRREYYDKWMRRAEIEKEELDHMVKMVKRERSKLGVRSRAMLLAGGIFPVSYLNPARPRWPYVLTRFY